MTIPKRFGFAAPRLRVNLLFQKQVVVNNVGFTYTNVRFTPTNAYDVDPTLGSTSMAGYSEYANLYRFYRVHSSKILVEFVNQESFGLMAFVSPFNVDPGANNSAASNIALSNPRTKQLTLGPATGSSIGRITRSMTTSMIGGVNSQSIFDNYSAGVGSGPGNNWYWVVGMFSPSALVNGVFASVRIEIDVEFFEYASIQS